MGQFSVENADRPGSDLNGNQQGAFCKAAGLDIDWQDDD